MDNENVRPILELFGDKGRLAQGAELELLVSLKNSELGFSLPITVAVLPTIGVSSMPSLTVGSFPSVTSNPTKPTIIAHGLLSGSGAVLLTAAAAYREVEIRFANVDTVARTYTYALNATTPGAVDDTHTQAKTSPLPVGYAAVERIPGLILGDVILGLCDSANKVSYTIWGVA